MIQKQTHRFRLNSATVFGPFLLTLIALFLFTIVGPAAARTEQTLLSGSEYNYPPFCIVADDGIAKGFSIDLLRTVVRAMEHDVTFRTGLWAEVKSWLANGEIQVLPLVGRTPERETEFDFTFPYLSLHGAIVVREGTADINNLNDLRGRQVAVMKGDNAEEFLARTDRGIQINTTTTFEDALRELSLGKHDAVVIQRLVALRLIKEMGISNLRVINRPLEEFRQDFCFAVREGDKETLALLNEGLSLVLADGNFRRLYSKWFAAPELPIHRRLVIGGDRNYPPYEYLDENGLPAGHNVELTRAIAQEMGFDVEIRLGNWKEIRQGLALGEIDAVHGMFYSSGRDQDFDFSIPHTVIHHVAVARRNEGIPPKSAAGLKGKRLVVMQGDIMHDFALENGLGDHLTTVETQEDALRELAGGKHDYALVARLPALSWIKENRLENLLVGQRPLLSPEYCYAVFHNQSALLAQLNDGLNIVEKTGEYRRIYKKWLGICENSYPEVSEILRYVAIVVGPLLLILIGSFMWSWTLRKRVAHRTTELRDNEQLLQSIIDSIPAPVFYKKAQGVYLGCNHALSDLIGLPKTSIIGRTAFEVAPDDLARQCHETDLAVMKTGEAQLYESEVVDSTGNRHQIMFQKAPLRDPNGMVGGIVGAMLDITDRKRAEEALREKEAFIRAILDNLPIGIAVNAVNPVVYFEYMNDNFLKIFRTTREAIAEPDSFWDAVYEDPDFRNLIRKKVLTDCTSGDPARMYWADVPITCKGEDTVYITAQNISIPDSNIMISTVWDVTERKRAEERIVHLNRVLRAIRDVNQLIVRERDRETLIHEGCRLLVKNRGYNSAMIVLTGMNDQPGSWAMAGLRPAIERMATTFFEQGEWPPCCGLAHSVGKIITIEDRVEVCGKCPMVAGYTDSISLCVRLEHGGANFGFLIAAVDSNPGVDTEEMSFFSEIAGDLAYALRVMKMEEAREKSDRDRKYLESQLFQSQKMEAVGRLAGGVAHDYNNMLTVIIGYTEMALERVDIDEPLHEDLEEILKSSKRSADITRQLLAFARKQTITPVVLDLNQTVEGMLKMLRRLIGEDIDLLWLPGEAVWPVKMDPSQVDQILANLCVNARDAIPGVGKVIIETNTMVFDDFDCADHIDYIPGEFVLLSVSDDGCGIDEERLDIVFEPFYTTKDIGQGTGLGLATVYGIVKQNGGFINIHSDLGKGTTLRIYLPRHRGDVADATILNISGTQRSCGETILLVEDEPSILNMVKMLLEGLGYRVLAAGSPDEAMNMAEEHVGEIQLLLTDVIMPGTNGRELSVRLQAIYKDLKCLFMSGYTSNVIVHHGVLDQDVHFIQKPLMMRDLANKIREILNSSTAI